jgi:uncharacterized protein YecE (DUF72 family)
VSGRILVGASSWSDRSLVHDSGWYPSRSMRAAHRMAYYASRFPVVEIDATRRFPPTPGLARQWVERTPDGFTMDLQAWTLLTGDATLPDSLWEDLRHEVKPEMRDRRRLYAGHLSREARVEAWSRFRHAVEPLREAHRLGAVVLRYPHWLKPGQTGLGLLAEAREMLADLRLVAELPNPHWLEGGQCEETLAVLEDLGMGFVCVEGGAAPPVVATTSELAMVRFHGRPQVYWDGDEPVVVHHGHRYAPSELAGWVPRLRELAEAASEVHALFANTYRDWAVTNADQLQSLLD